MLPSANFCAPRSAPRPPPPRWPLSRPASAGHWPSRPTTTPAPFKDVKHVVLLMQENRSFDSYFGTFKGVRGLRRPFRGPDCRTARTSSTRRYTKTTRRAPSRPIGSTRARAMRSAPAARRTPGPTRRRHGTTAACASGPTAKNRCRWLLRGRRSTVPARAGRSLHAVRPLPLRHAYGHDRRTACSTGAAPTARAASARRRQRQVGVNKFNGGNDVGPSSQGWTWTTYADRLEKAGVKWKVYQSLDRQLRLQRDDGLPPLASRDRACRRHAARLGRPRHYAAGPCRRPYDPAIDDALSPLAKGFGNTMPYGSCRHCARTSRTARCRRCRGSSRPRPIASTPGHRALRRAAGMCRKCWTR